MMDRRLAEWFASGDTGSSSQAIALWLAARVTSRSCWGASTPSDVSDLGRCLRLLARIPEWKDRIGEMAEAGGMWPTFAARWAEMEASYYAEKPKDGERWRGEKTYALMKEVEREAREKDRPGFKSVDLGEGVSVRFSA